MNIKIRRKFYENLDNSSDSDKYEISEVTPKLVRPMNEAIKRSNLKFNPFRTSILH